MENTNGLLKNYIIGFILSVLLTLGAYYPVSLHLSTHHRYPTHEFIIPFILGLAFVQLLVQMFFFLHMGRETQPRWKLFMAISFIGIIIVVVVASIWIMQHLNYNMSLIRLDSVMQNGEGF